MSDNNALLLRDGDGEVYFLGHEDLARYRLTGDRAEAANAALDEAESDEVFGLVFEGRGDYSPQVHATQFRSIVYAPVMQGYSFATAYHDR